MLAIAIKLIASIGLVGLAAGYDYCAHRSIPAKWQLKPFRSTVRSPCCDISDDQWKLIAWYFARVSSFIEITEVIPERQTKIHASRIASIFSKYFAQELYEKTGFDSYTKRVDYAQRDEALDKTDHLHRAYRWHAELSKNSINNTHVINIEAKLPAYRKVSSTVSREDEPDFGSVVLASSILTLNNYLKGESRRPFLNKRANYILIVYKQPTAIENWDKLAAAVLSRIWMYHGILNAIVLSACMKDKVGYYDPFVNSRDLGITDADEWGVFSQLKMKYLNLSDPWILQKESNLNGFPLTFTVFERYPTMVANVPPAFGRSYIAAGMHETGYGGIDGLILGNLAKYLNFTTIIMNPNSIDNYGDKKMNGSFTGTLGDILYGDADAAFNSRFLINYASTNIEYLWPTLGDKVCVVAPAARRIPQWKSIFKCFDFWFWFAFCTVTVVTSVSYVTVDYFLKRLQRKRVRKTIFYRDYRQYVVEERYSVESMHMVIFRVLIGMSTHMPKRMTARLIIAACLLANVIIIGSFESLLYNVYTKPQYFDEIDTLTDLDNSALKISISSPVFFDLFGNNGTEVLRSLNEKFYFHDDDSQNAMARAATQGDVCMVERHSDIQLIIQTRHLDADGRPTLHVVKECPRHYFLTYITRKDWPFLPKFNQILYRLAEGGFTKLWYDSTVEAFIRTTRMKIPNQEAAHPFSLKNIETPFYFLIIGYMLSCFAFVVERCIVTPGQLRKFTEYIGWSSKGRGQCPARPLKRRRVILK